MHPSPLVLLVVLAGCTSTVHGVVEGDAQAPETRQDLVDAFLREGWTVRPVSLLAPDGLVGRGTAYRVSDRTVLVYDYASPEQAAEATRDDARRLAGRSAGRSARVYLRPSLVVVTYEPFGRTAFDLRLARLLSGPSLAGAVAARGASVE